VAANSGLPIDYPAAQQNQTLNYLSKPGDDMAADSSWRPPSHLNWGGKQPLAQLGAAQSAHHFPARLAVVSRRSTVLAHNHRIVKKANS